MKQKILALLLSMAMVFALSACGADDFVEIIAVTVTNSDAEGVIGGADGPTAVLVTDGENSWSDTLEEDGGEAEVGTTDGSGESPYEELPSIDEYGTYNSVEDVSLYLYTYGYLPENYITKNEARDLGWEGGSVERWAGEGAAIGGDKFGNKEGLLPKAEGRQYYECDIDTVGESGRGAKRIVWSNDGLIYYTPDHYESFELLYGEE